MDVKAVAQMAKTYVADLFSDEGIINVGLEEVEFDEDQNKWIVTVGFSRPWDRRNLIDALKQPGRSYKVLHIADTDGRVLSLEDRVLSKRN